MWRRLIACVCVIAVAFGARAQEPAGGAPLEFEKLKDAKAGVVYNAVAQTKGLTLGLRTDRLRYQLRLPEGFTRDKPRNLVVILHDTGADYSWGFSKLDALTFRPMDMLVAVDGTSARDAGGRTWNEAGNDVLVMRDFLLEMTRGLPVDRIILLGHGRGGLFATMALAGFPRLIDGVVVSGAGAWERTQVRGTRTTPICFMHGTANERFGYFSSLDARDAYVDDDHPMIALRRLRGLGDTLAPQQASECIDWCLGMRTDDAKVALAAAQRICAAKPAGANGRVFMPPLGLARQVLRRFDPDDKRFFKDADEATKKAGFALGAAIEGHALKHATALKSAIAPGQALAFDASQPPSAQAWIGHVLSVREDLRGTDALEGYLKSILFDDFCDRQTSAGRELMGELDESEEPVGEKLIKLIDAIPTIGLCDAIVPEKMEMFLGWASESGKAKELEPKMKVLGNWSEAIRLGTERARAIDAEWKTPSP
jgi:predicted esterase